MSINKQNFKIKNKNKDNDLTLAIKEHQKS